MFHCSNKTALYESDTLYNLRQQKKRVKSDFIKAVHLKDGTEVQR